MITALDSSVLWAIATAARMGIHARHAATFAANEDDIHASNEVFARKISTSRKASMMCSLNELEIIPLHEGDTCRCGKNRLAHLETLVNAA